MWMRRPGDIKPDGLPARALHAHFLCNAGAGEVFLLHKRGERVQAQTTRQFLQALIDRNGLTVHREDTQLLFDAVERLQGIIRARCAARA